MGPCTGDIKFLMKHGAKHFANATEQLRIAILYG